jgi:hypothetical protein
MLPGGKQTNKKLQTQPELRKTKLVNSDTLTPKMDASTIFESVLTSVKQSRLNYLVTRTPFSATICLKRSFSKHQYKPVDVKARPKITKHLKKV